MAERVDIKVRVPLEVDTGAATAAFRQLPEQLRQSMEQSVKAPASWAEQMLASRGQLVGGRTATEQVAARALAEQTAGGRARVELERPSLLQRIRQVFVPAPGPAEPESEPAAEQTAGGRARSRLDERVRGLATYGARMKEVNRVIVEQRQFVRDLGDELSRAEQKQDQHSRASLDRRKRVLTEERHVLRAMLSEREMRVQGDPGGQAPGLMQGMTLRQAMGGAGLTRMMDTLGGIITRHPLLATLIAGAAGAHVAANLAHAVSSYGMERETGFADAGRRMGLGTQLRDEFTGYVKGKRISGKTPHEFEKLGYAGEDIQRMVEAYGMREPGLPAPAKQALEKDILAQAKFARATGIAPEMVSGMGRRVAQVGVADAGRQPDFWEHMAKAVQLGTTMGVDATETMKSLLAWSEQSAKSLGVVSQEYVKGLTGVQALAAQGEGRFFKGELGAQHLSTILQSVQHPQQLATERFIMNAIMGHFGGRPPTATQLGLRGPEGEAYGQMNEIQQLRVVMQRLPEFMESKDETTRQLMSGLMRTMGQTFGGKPLLQMLGFQNITGLSESAMLSMMKELSVPGPFTALEPGDLLRPAKGMAHAEAGKPFDLVADLLDSDRYRDMQARIKGQKIDTEPILFEKVNQKFKESHELLSTGVANLTADFQLLERNVAATTLAFGALVTMIAKAELIPKGMELPQALKDLWQQGFDLGLHPDTPGQQRKTLPGAPSP